MPVITALNRTLCRIAAPTVEKYSGTSIPLSDRQPRRKSPICSAPGQLMKRNPFSPPVVNIYPQVDCSGHIQTKMRHTLCVMLTTRKRSFMNPSEYGMSAHSAETYIAIAVEDLLMKVDKSTLHIVCVCRLARSPRPAELSSRSAELEQWHRPD